MVLVTKIVLEKDKILLESENKSSDKTGQKKAKTSKTVENEDICIYFTEGSLAMG